MPFVYRRCHEKTSYVSNFALSFYCMNWSIEGRCTNYKNSSVCNSDFIARSVILVFQSDVFALYRPIYALKWKMHHLTHRRFFRDNDGMQISRKRGLSGGDQEIWWKEKLHTLRLRVVFFKGDPGDPNTCKRAERSYRIFTDNALGFVFFSDISERNKDYFDTLDFRRGDWGRWVWSRFSFWRSLITNPQCCWMFFHSVSVSFWKFKYHQIDASYIHIKQFFSDKSVFSGENAKDPSGGTY